MDPQDEFELVVVVVLAWLMPMMMSTASVIRAKAPIVRPGLMLLVATLSTSFVATAIRFRDAWVDGPFMPTMLSSTTVAS